MTRLNQRNLHGAGPPAARAGAGGIADSDDEFARPASATGPEVYSIRDVARIFGRTERTVRNWVRAGHLQRGGVGRSVFFSRAAIDALLGTGSGRPTPGQHESSP